MTYFMFLALFLGIPIAVLSLLTILDFRRGKWLPQDLSGIPAWAAMIGICVIALIYTTPWDNYLVATNVWWYDVDLVNGLVIGYVPIEEYTFFLLQPIMTSLLLMCLMRYLPLPKAKHDHASAIRVRSTGVVAVVWAISTVVLVLTFVSDAFKPATYLTLETSWALIPVMIQLAFGADILWRHRRVVVLTITISTLYLAWADSIAITSGTWTIDPEQSFHNIMLGGVLPIEEFIFFFLTNTLVTLGFTLAIAEASQERARQLEKYAVLQPLARLLTRKRPSTEEDSSHEKGLLTE